MTPSSPASKTIPLLQLQQLATSRNVLADITCSCQAGEVTAVIGPSGGGKSSLIRLINRLEDPSSGQILLAGQDIRELPPSLLRQRVGMMLRPLCLKARCWITCSNRRRIPRWIYFTFLVSSKLLALSFLIKVIQ